MTETITIKNLKTLVYEADSGVSYELCPGCVRTMKEPTVKLDRLFSDIMSKEKMGGVETDEPVFWVNARMNVISHVTEGDDLPEDYDDVYTKVMNRVVEDFLRMRYLSVKRPTASQDTTGEIQQ